MPRMPTPPPLIYRGDAAITPYTCDAVISATPDAVFRASSVKEIQELLYYCHAKKIPVTCCGARTSMTGSSVSDTGIVMSLEKLSGIVEVNASDLAVTVLPGTILGEMQRAVEAEGFFYPPSPTSRNECTVGASIITNATGDTTFKYGSTRRYVNELTVVMADGTLRKFTRKNPPPLEFKNKAGYFLNGEEIDYFIGSEGTLGIVVEAQLKLLEGVPEFMTFMIPFLSNVDALHFISTHAQHGRISPRTMEYVDEAAARIMRTHSSFPKLSDDARAFVICQQEFLVGGEDDAIDAWLSVLYTVHTQQGAASLTDSVIVARTGAEQDKVTTWRHHIPSIVAEKHRELQMSGGGKVGTDWWVPLPQMMEMMSWIYSESDNLNIPYIAFAHLGNGHPHVNYLTRNPDEKERAKVLVVESCRRAVAVGGGVAGEHGIGKLKRDLLAIQHPQNIIDEMRALKSKYDPQWILAPGNIFNSPNI